MFERYTEKARRVIFFARYEASQFGAPAIEPEHLLLGLMREDETLMARFLARAQANPEVIRKEVEGRAPLREKISTSVELPLAPETKQVLQYAHEESGRLQHRHIGTEHLLLGLLREERSMAAEILYERGLRLNAVREEVAIVNPIEQGLSQISVWAEAISAYGDRLSSLAKVMLEQMDDAATGKVNVMNEDMITKPQRTGPLKDAQLQSAVGRSHPIILGVEKLLADRRASINGARVGLVCHPASVDHSLQHVADLFKAQHGCTLTALFGPQHGIRGDVQDNMIESPHAFDQATGLPIYSLYSEIREPTERMLEEVDVIVFDMQDVGCRIYTFVYTMANCMRAARKHGKKIVVCDRPNPIGGVHVAGTVLEAGFESFVGQFPIATRHGMTVGELALMFNEQGSIGCDLEVIEMDGWNRQDCFDDTDIPWVMPSPNMPTLDTATVFPGTVHLEGTQMSEGRGTTRPFEIVGAPYIDPDKFSKTLNRHELQGVRFRPIYFLPTFQKHAGQVCGGVQLHVLERDVFESVIAGVAIVKTAFELYGEQFKWKEPPYEYVYDKNPFDVIAGTDALRRAVERGDSLADIEQSWRGRLAEFSQLRDRYLLYREA